jgi:tRNA/tmRNA/rRNA uracil-C5-methylase (TrmA/RlmC/RlmD family)
VLRRLTRLRPRAVAYVACDPAALGRDVATLAGLGWRLAELRAFDLFPMTHHVECVAVFRPGAPGDAGRISPEGLHPR